MRHKKQLAKAAEEFSKAEPPRNGDNTWGRAMSLVRAAVRENLRHGTKVTGFGHCYGEPPSITIEVPMTMHLPIRTGMEGGRHSVAVEGSMSFYMDPSADLMPQLQGVMDTLRKVTALSDLGGYLGEADLPGTGALEQMFSPRALKRMGIEPHTPKGVSG